MADAFFFYRFLRDIDWSMQRVFICFLPDAGGDAQLNKHTSYALQAVMTENFLIQ